MADKKTGNRHLSVFSTELGWAAATWDRGQLCRLVFGYECLQDAMDAVQRDDLDFEADDKPSRQVNRFVGRLQAYCDGKRDDFLDVPVTLKSRTEFQRLVLERCRQIPYGQTLTYAELADECGSPRAYRAVGNVMASNHIPLVIPCHRVVGANGSLGGYSARSGLSMKRRLLRLEGAEFVG